MKTAIITGATSGLGLACASEILKQRDWDVILAVRDAERGNHVARKLQSTYGPNRAAVRAIDLASLSSVKAFSEGLKRDDIGIDAFIGNAGAQFVTPGIIRTVDGYEATFAINYLSYFLLLNLITPCLRKNARVVLVSSGTHDPNQRTGFPEPVFVSTSDWAQPSEDGKSESATVAGRRRYATSKVAIIMLAYELDRRLQGSDRNDIRINAMDPGMMPGTGLARGYPTILRFAWNYVMPVMTLFAKNVNTVQHSARNLAKLAIDLSFSQFSGQYFTGTQTERSSDLSYDLGSQKRLFDESLEIVRLDK